jgi:phosphatidate cytidylyltransferase
MKVGDDLDKASYKTKNALDKIKKASEKVRHASTKIEKVSTKVENTSLKSIGPLAKVKKVYSKLKKNTLLIRANKLAGRNLVTSLLTAFILIGVITCSLLFFQLPFVLLVIVVSILSMFELGAAFSRAKIALPILMLSLASIGVIYYSYVAGVDTLVQTMIICSFAICSYCAFDIKKPNRIHNALAGLFTLSYVPMLLAFSVLLLNQSYGELKVALCVLVAVANDTGGWIAGRIFGKHALSPKISPNKTIEGLVGSLILTITVSYVFLDVICPKGITKHYVWFPLVLAVLGVIFGTLGDLFESLLKRTLNIKDMGEALRGHGGFLDRIDSALFIFPLIYYLFMFSL